MYDKYNIDSYRTLMDRESLLGGVDKLVENLQVFLSDVFFAIIRLFYQFSVSVLQVVSQLNILSTNVDSLFKNALAFYEPLYTYIFPFLLGGAFLYWFYQFAFGTMQRANRFLGAFLCVVIVNMVVLTQGNHAVKTLEKLSMAVETVAIQSMLSPLKEVDEQITVTQLTQENTTRQLYNFIHDELLGKSFALVNFGQYQYDDNVMGQYLIENKDSERFNEIRVEKDKLVEQTSDTSIFLTAGKGMEKIILSFVVMIYSFFVMVFVIGLMLVKVILQMALLLMIILLPLFSLMALVPKYTHVLVNYLGNFVRIFVIMPLMVLLTFVYFYLFRVIDMHLFALNYENTVGVFLLSTVIKVIGVVLSYKYRHKIVKMLATGHIVNVNTMGNQLLSQVSRFKRENMLKSKKALANEERETNFRMLPLEEKGVYDVPVRHYQKNKQVNDNVDNRAIRQEDKQNHTDNVDVPLRIQKRQDIKKQVFEQFTDKLQALRQMKKGKV